MKNKGKESFEKKIISLVGIFLGVIIFILGLKRTILTYELFIESNGLGFNELAPLIVLGIFSVGLILAGILAIVTGFNELRKK